MNIKRWMAGLALCSLGLLTWAADGAEINPNKVKRLLEEMKSDNDELAQVATMELAGLGEEGLSVIDEMLRMPGDHDREFEAYREVVQKIRKSTPITIHQEKGKALDVLKEIIKQSGMKIKTSSATIESQLAAQEINLGVEKMPFWALMDMFAQQSDLRVSADMTLNAQGYNPPGSKIAGDWTFVYSMSTDYGVDYETRKRTGTNLKLHMRTYLDPKRAHMLNRTEIKIHKATDDAGNVYVQPVDNMEPARIQNTTLRSEANFDTTLYTKGIKGKTLTIRGATIHYGGPAEAKTVDIANLESQTIDVGIGKVSVGKVDLNNNGQLSLYFRMEDWRVMGPMSFNAQIQSLAPNCVWVEDDQGGKSKLSMMSMSNMQNQINITLRTQNAPAARGARAGNAAKISKVTFSFPRNLDPAAIPFEIKGIPLP